MSIKDKDLRDQALVFYEEDIQAIEAILDAFLKKSLAKCSLLVDQDGHMITARGQTDNVDLDTISALVAGSFAATKALAHQFGEEEFTALFHQGNSGNIQLTLVGERALLTALFEDTTTVGMVRLYANESAKRLTEIFRRKAADNAPRPTDPTGQPDEDPTAFREGSAGALDDVLGDD